MLDDLKLEILPTGHIKFKRGDREHNKKLLEILSYLVEGDQEIIEELKEFFKGSEEVKVIVGDTIFCG